MLVKCARCRKDYQHHTSMCYDCFLKEKQNHETSEAVVPLNDLLSVKGRAKLYIDANVWDGEDRTGATGDSARFTPDELQELIDEMLEHLST